MANDNIKNNDSIKNSNSKDKDKEEKLKKIAERLKARQKDFT